jgi:hypothetical protein
MTLGTLIFPFTTVVSSTIWTVRFSHPLGADLLNWAKSEGFDTNSLAAEFPKGPIPESNTTGWPVSGS